MQKSYFINTYGCQMNVHESEKIAGILSAMDMVQAQAADKADVIVFNTCCVRQTAEARIFGHLGKAKKLKEANPDIKIILCGCLPQQPNAIDALKKRFPYVNIIIGTHNIPLLGEYLKLINDRGGRVCEVLDDGCAIEVGPKRPEGIKAFVNIMYGCNNFCSYCIVPFVRGRERSKPFDDILKEVDGLIKNGYKDITLLGQNVNSYSYNEKNFAALLRELNALSQTKYRIRFMTSHPKDLSSEVVDVIAGSSNIAKHIHLPVQAGSDRVLRLMNRKYSRADYLKKIEMIREKIPDAGITSDIMVGFPSETEEDFLDTASLVETVRFNNIFSFIYNRRSGTEADKMADQIPKETKIDRIERLIKLQSDIGADISKNQLSKTFEVLIEEKKKNQCFGKTDNDIAMSFESEKSIGEFVMVTATDYKNTRLIGEIKTR